MRYWVYKCNAKNMPHQVAWGDWDTVFERRKAVRWGSTETVPALAKLSAGDLILAYQTNRNELVGLVQVMRLKKRGPYLDLFVKPVKEIRVKVRPLKQRDAQVRSIPALQPGPIKTIYDISVGDAQALLRAAGSSHHP